MNEGAVINSIGKKERSEPRNEKNPPSLGRAIRNPTISPETKGVKI